MKAVYDATHGLSFDPATSAGPSRSEGGVGFGSTRSLITRDKAKLVVAIRYCTGAKSRRRFAIILFRIAECVCEGFFFPFHFGLLSRIACEGPIQYYTITQS